MNTNTDVKLGGVLPRIGTTLKINNVNKLITTANQNSLRKPNLTYESLQNKQFLPTLDLQNIDLGILILVLRL